MISLDWSIVPAIIIFILTVVALNYLLFRPVTGVQREREQRTTGLISKTQQDLAHQLHLFDQYQATVKSARMEGYRTVEKARAEAMAERGRTLEQARKNAVLLLEEARESIRNQVSDTRSRLDLEAREIARQISAAILHRFA